MSSNRLVSELSPSIQFFIAQMNGKRAEETRLRKQAREYVKTISAEQATPPDLYFIAVNKHQQESKGFGGSSLWADTMTVNEALAAQKYVKEHFADLITNKPVTKQKYT